MGRSSVQQCKDTPHTPGQVKSYKGCPEATSAMKKLLSVPIRINLKNMKQINHVILKKCH